MALTEPLGPLVGIWHLAPARVRHFHISTTKRGALIDGVDLLGQRADLASGQNFVMAAGGPQQTAAGSRFLIDSAH